MEVPIVAAGLEVRWQDGQIIHTLVTPFCIFEDGPTDLQSGGLFRDRDLYRNFENFFGHSTAGRHQSRELLGLLIGAEVVISVGILFNNVFAWPLFPG